MGGLNFIGKAGRYLGERFARNQVVLLVFAVALAVRIFVYFHTAMLNPDGPVYIFQARALAALDWGAMTKSGVAYISIYPMLIYVAHLFFASWDTAAQMVSIFFGTALLIPVYLLLREFFAKPVCLCTTLVIGLVPIMVCTSVDVVRDPVAWFFLATGQLLVVLALRRGRRALLLPALAAFVLATWARIDAFVYILATAVSLPMISWRDFRRNFCWFCGPLLMVAVLGLFLVLAGGRLVDLFRFGEILQRADLFGSYGKFRMELAGILANHRVYSPATFFLLEAKRFAWLIALAGVVNRLFEALSYGFSLIFLLGAWRFRQRFAAEELRPYFPVICGLSFLLLYVFMMQIWVMDYRYAVLIIIGGVVILGVGVEWLMECLGRHLKPAGVLLVTGALLFLSVAPKIFQDRGASEVVFKEIGSAAAALSPGSEPVLIMASGDHIRLLTHFANNRRPVPQSPEPLFSTYPSMPGGGPAELADYLRANHIGFLLWEENNWPPEAGFSGSDVTPGIFTKVGQWDNRQTGRMVLYRVD